MAANGSSNGSATAPAPVASRALTKANQKKLQRTQAEAEELERRTKAYQYRLRGWTLRRIGSELNVSYSTVKRDLDIMQKSMAQSFEDFDPNELVASELQGYDDLLTRAWEEYEQGVNVNQRIKALDFVRTVKADRFTMLKHAGIIRAAPKEVNHKVAVGVAAVNWNEEVKQAASEAILQGLLSKQPLLEPVPDDYELADVLDLEVEGPDLDDDDDDDDFLVP